MVNIKHGYDIENKSFIIRYENNLIRDNFDLFEEIAKQSIPNAKIKRDSTNSCVITIPFEGNASMSTSTVDGAEIGVMSVALPVTLVQNVDNLFGNFILKAIDRQIKTLEIIPLKNYPINDICTDVKNAVANKRDICIIEDYKDYLSGKNVIVNCETMKQAVYKYLSDEYCNVVVACTKDGGNLKNLRSLVKKDMKFVDWI